MFGAETAGLDPFRARANAPLLAPNRLMALTVTSNTPFRRDARREEVWLAIDMWSGIGRSFGKFNSIAMLKRDDR
jgi:hypothetical protein